MSLSRYTKPKRHAHHYAQITGGPNKDWLVTSYSRDFVGRVYPVIHRSTTGNNGMGNIAHVESFRAELFVLFGLRTRVVTFHLPRRPKWAPPKYPSLEPRP
jgi:hypothetical protein